RDIRLAQLSWRDPSGFVIRQGKRILRAVEPGAAPRLRRLLDSPWYRQRTADGWFPGSRWLAEAPAGVRDAERFVWLEHQALAFPCYPHEITALQLYDAAKLTLTICGEALEQDMVLKDASAWNVLFDSGRP